jgi:hypothetical protein
MRLMYSMPSSTGRSLRQPRRHAQKLQPESAIQSTAMPPADCALRTLLSHHPITCARARLPAPAPKVPACNAKAVAGPLGDKATGVICVYTPNYTGERS